MRNIKVIAPLGKSDHGIVVGDFICEWKSRVEPKKRRAYYKGDYKGIIGKLNMINWEEEFRGKSVQDCWERFKAIVILLVEEFIPMVKPKDYNEPWMNSKIMKLWKKKQHAWNRVRTYGWAGYKRSRNKLRKTIRKARRLYERKIARKARHNKRAFYKYVRSRLTVRPEITTIRNEDGQLKENDIDLTEIIGRYFDTVFTSFNGEEMPEMQQMTEARTQNIRITQEMVQTKLEKLNVHKSCGPDGIHPYVLQRSAK